MSLELMGVPVRVCCADDEARDRLALCYQAFATVVDPGVAPLTANLEGGGDHWTVDIEGRESRTETGLIEAVRSFNHELLHGVMRRAPELFYVHAGVITWETAVVFPGLSQAGKSTLVLAALQQGARFLSDELLAFDPVTRLCRPFPRALKIRDVCAPYFPDLKGTFVGVGEGRFLPFEALPAEVVAPPSKVGAVVVPQWNPEHTRLVELTPGQALLNLTSSTLNFGTHREESINHLTRIMAEARAFRLDWRDPHEAVTALLAALRNGP